MLQRSKHRIFKNLDILELLNYYFWSVNFGIMTSPRISEHHVDPQVCRQSLDLCLQCVGESQYRSWRSINLGFGYPGHGNLWEVFKMRGFYINISRGCFPVWLTSPRWNPVFSIFSVQKNPEWNATWVKELTKQKHPPPFLLCSFSGQCKITFHFLYMFFFWGGEHVLFFFDAGCNGFMTLAASK